jgi:hypothetical protein
MTLAFQMGAHPRQLSTRPHQSSCSTSLQFCTAQSNSVRLNLRTSTFKGNTSDLELGCKGSLIASRMRYVSHVLRGETYSCVWALYSRFLFVTWSQHPSVTETLPSPLQAHNSEVAQHGYHVQCLARLVCASKPTCSAVLHGCFAHMPMPWVSATGVLLCCPRARCDGCGTDKDSVLSNVP